jgi:hypothetical protein
MKTERKREGTSNYTVRIQLLVCKEKSYEDNQFSGERTITFFAYSSELEDTQQTMAWRGLNHKGHLPL